MSQLQQEVKLNLFVATSIVDKNCLEVEFIYLSINSVIRTFL